MSEETSPKASKDQEKGWRNIVRAAGLVSLTAVAPPVGAAQPPSTESVEPTKNEIVVAGGWSSFKELKGDLDRLKEIKNRGREEPQPPAVPTMQETQQQPAAAPEPSSNNSASPQKFHNEELYQGYRGRAVDLTTDDLHFTDSKLAYYEMRSLLFDGEVNKNVDAFVKSYYHFTQLNAFEEKKRDQFDKVIATINELEEPNRAEVVARIARDMHEKFSDGTNKPVIDIMSAVFKVFSMAKHIRVEYKVIPGGRSNSTIDNVEPQDGSFRQYLKENTFHHTDPKRIVHGMDPREADRAVSGEHKRRGAQGMAR